MPNFLDTITWRASDGTTKSLDTELSNKVPISRTVNGKALSSNITLNASDIGAVPTSRTINGKALSSNITLTQAEVGHLYLHLFLFEDTSENITVNFQVISTRATAYTSLSDVYTYLSTGNNVSGSQGFVYYPCSGRRYTNSQRIIYIACRIPRSGDSLFLVGVNTTTGLESNDSYTFSINPYTYHITQIY